MSGTEGKGCRKILIRLEEKNNYGKSKVLRTITYREAINEALKEEMEMNERAFLLGEDVGAFGGAKNPGRNREKLWCSALPES